MYNGKLVNLLEASLIGYELIYVDKKKKLQRYIQRKNPIVTMCQLH